MREKKLYKLLGIIGVLYMLMGIFILLEGGFHISTLRANKLDKVLPSSGYSLVMEDTAQKDVIVQVYKNKKEDTYSVLEFSKNTLFPRYALTEKHDMPKRKDTYCTVVSSAFYDHVYFVDYENNIVKIEQGQHSDKIGWAITHLLFGIGWIAMIFWKLRKEN